MTNQNEKNTATTPRCAYDALLEKHRKSVTYSVIEELYSNFQEHKHIDYVFFMVKYTKKMLRSNNIPQNTMQKAFCTLVEAVGCTPTDGETGTSLRKELFSLLFVALPITNVDSIIHVLHKNFILDEKDAHLLRVCSCNDIIELVEQLDFTNEEVDKIFYDRHAWLVKALLHVKILVLTKPSPKKNTLKAARKYSNIKRHHAKKLKKALDELDGYRYASALEEGMRIKRSRASYFSECTIADNDLEIE